MATATAPSPPATAWTATLPPQISAGADCDGSEPSRHSVDSDAGALSGPPAAVSCHATKQLEHYYGINGDVPTPAAGSCLELCGRESLRSRPGCCSPAAIAVLIALHLLREVLPTIHPVHVRWFLDLETRASVRQVGRDTFEHCLEIRIRYT